MKTDPYCENALSKNQTSNAQLLAEISIPRALWKLSVPIVLANLLGISYQLVNTFWVGRLGANAVAAVTVSYPIFVLLTAIGFGISFAGSTLIAQYAGARNNAKVNRIAMQTLLLVVAISLLISILGFSLTPWILSAMHVNPDIFEDSAKYMQLSFLVTIFMFISIVFQSVLGGIGEVKVPLYVMAFSVALNLILDPLFIFGFGIIPSCGIAGAAWATLIAEGFSAAAGLFILSSNRYGICLQLKNCAPDPLLIKRIFLLGIPTSLEQSMQALGIAVITTIVSNFGTYAIAAYGIGYRVFSFVLIPAMGLSMAIATLVGQSIGSGNYRRADSVAVLGAGAAFAILTLAGAVTFFTADSLTQLFVVGEPALISEGARTIRFMAISFGLFAAQSALSGAFRGAGNTFFSMILTVIATWVVQIPLGWILSRYTILGLDGLWLTYPLSAFVAVVVACIKLRAGVKTKMGLLNANCDFKNQTTASELQHSQS